jgi:PhnB protein
MASDHVDGMGDASPNGNISLSGGESDLLHGYYDKLADGGTVDVPLEKAPWGDEFGQVKDKFGVSWLVNIAGSPG